MPMPTPGEAGIPTFFVFSALREICPNEYLRRYRLACRGLYAASELLTRGVPALFWSVSAGQATSEQQHQGVKFRRY